MTQPAPTRQFLTPDSRPISAQLAAAFRQPWAIAGVGAIVGSVVGSWVTIAGFILGAR